MRRLTIISIFQVSHYKKDEVTEACNQRDKVERGFYLEMERDYSLIQRHMDLNFYTELVNRPIDWSEKKDKHGIPLKTDKKRAATRNGGGFNGSNVEPLGKRHRRSSSSSLSYRGNENQNNVCLEAGKKNQETAKFDFQPLTSEEQGKRIVEKLDTLSKNIRKCLLGGKGNRVKIEHSINTFSKLLDMFSRQQEAKVHKQDIDNFQGEYQRFQEMMRLEDDLISTLERRLKKFDEDVNSSLMQHNGVFRDQNQYHEYVDYADEFYNKIHRYSNSQGDIPRQSKDEIDAKIEKLFKGIQKLKSEIKLVSIRMRNGHHEPRSPPPQLVGSNGVNGNKPIVPAVEDKKNQRLKEEFHNNVLEHVRQNMRKYYENSIQVEMVKIATRADYDSLCESVAKLISNKEIERWINEKMPLKDICLVPKMLDNIEKYIDGKMKRKPALAGL